MRYNKEDWGLYLSLMFVGGGIGVLTASFIAARIEKVGKKFEDLGKAAEDLSETVGVLAEIDEFDAELLNEAEELDAEYQREYQLFIEEYQHNPMQTQMLASGVVTLNELKEMLDGSEDYQDFQKPDSILDMEAPDEDEGLVEEWPIVFGRHTLSIVRPKDKDNKRMRVVYYDREDQACFVLTRSKSPIPQDPRKILNIEEWSVLQNILNIGNHPVVFVDDLETTKWYRFELIPEHVEESLDDDDPDG